MINLQIFEILRNIYYDFSSTYKTETANWVETAVCRLLEGWRQPVRFKNFLAEIRFCCFGSPTTFIVTNIRKMPNWMGQYILKSGSIFLFTKIFQDTLAHSVWHFSNNYDCKSSW